MVHATLFILAIPGTSGVITVTIVIPGPSGVTLPQHPPCQSDNTQWCITQKQGMVVTRDSWCWSYQRCPTCTSPLPAGHDPCGHRSLPPSSQAPPLGDDCLHSLPLQPQGPDPRSNAMSLPIIHSSITLHTHIRGIHPLHLIHIHCLWAPRRPSDCALCVTNRMQRAGHKVRNLASPPEINTVFNLASFDNVLSIRAS
jgi:hypothetical protein